jgi:hypothetical protein
MKSGWCAGALRAGLGLGRASRRTRAFVRREGNRDHRDHAVAISSETTAPTDLCRLVRALDDLGASLISLRVTDGLPVMLMSRPRAPSIGSPEGGDATLRRSTARCAAGDVVAHALHHRTSAEVAIDERAR